MEDYSTCEELEGRIASMETTIGLLMGVVQKGNEERNSLTEALLAAEEQIRRLSAAAGTQQPQMMITNNCSGGGAAGVGGSFCDGSTSTRDCGGGFLGDSTDEQWDTDFLNEEAGGQSSSNGPNGRQQRSNAGLNASQRRVAGVSPATSTSGGNTNNNNHGPRSVSPYLPRKLEDSGLPNGKMIPRGVGYKSPYSQSALNSNSNSFPMSPHRSKGGGMGGGNSQNPNGNNGGTPTSGRSAGGQQHNASNNNDAYDSLNESQQFGGAFSGIPRTNSNVGGAAGGVNVVTTTRYRRMYDFEKLEPRIRDHVLNLEIENKQLKKEVEAMGKELRKRDSETRHQHRILERRVFHAESYAAQLAEQAAQSEVELRTTKKNYQELSQQLKWIAIQQGQMGGGNGGGGAMMAMGSGGGSANGNRLAPNDGGQRIYRTVSGTSFRGGSPTTTQSSDFPSPGGGGGPIPRYFNPSTGIGGFSRTNSNANSTHHQQQNYGYNRRQSNTSSFSQNQHQQQEDLFGESSVEEVEGVAGNSANAARAPGDDASVL